MPVVDRTILRLAVYEILLRERRTPGGDRRRGDRAGEAVRLGAVGRASSTACSTGCCTAGQKVPGSDVSEVEGRRAKALLLGASGSSPRLARPSGSARWRGDAARRLRLRAGGARLDTAAPTSATSTSRPLENKTTPRTARAVPHQRHHRRAGDAPALHHRAQRRSGRRRQLQGAVTRFRVTPVTFNADGPRHRVRDHDRRGMSFERSGSEGGGAVENDRYLFRETYEIDESETGLLRPRERSHQAGGRALRREHGERPARRLLSEGIEPPRPDPSLTLRTNRWRARRPPC